MCFVFVVVCFVFADVCRIALPPAPVLAVPDVDPFVCESADSSTCEGTVYKSCATVDDGEFYEVQQRDCGAEELQCAPGRGCAIR